MANGANTKRISRVLSRGALFSAIVLGGIVLLPRSASAQFDTAAIDWAIQELCGHIHGHLGGLLVTVSAFGAVVAAAFGTYRVFYGAIITAVGSFAIVNIMSLYFPDASNQCNTGAGGNNGGAAPPPEAPAPTRIVGDAPNLTLDRNVIAAAPDTDDDEDAATKLVD